MRTNHTTKTVRRRRTHKRPSLSKNRVTSEENHVGCNLATSATLRPCYLRDVNHVEALGLRERKKLRTRQAIAASALRLFAEHGYDETTIADITAAADVSPRTFFSYFPSKEDVVFAEVDDRLAQVREGLTRPRPGESPLAAIRRSVVDVIEALATQHGEFGATQVRLIFERPALQARAQQRMHDAQQEVEELVRELCPEIGETDAVVVSGIAIGGMQAVVIHCRRYGYEPADMRIALDRALDIMEHGLASVSALAHPGAPATAGP
jgi:AcrR family transcriptional regulator